ncbi:MULTISPECIES: alpha/beta fold hydrolase [unclassified Gordonia (in: high G+C Gram-positive bacteria)]|uniref:alpha/beta fold hydrolase n=1 Tax=unclassified Gordonia (in: high G+C Gram-positive bacteria) TaxID=2657482 RepID=UPI001FFECA28|nr:alpha/beta fold hydrolase [Gordonia sp. PP30]UQE75746.1 alpha/beta hydrolase [Gordonia sp. PP30]
MGKNSLGFGSLKRAVGHVVRPYPVRDLPEGRYLELPGRGTTFITDSGPREAPVLFLLHSVATTGLLCWYPVIPELGRDFRVITIDHRWHGRGIRSADFTLELCADDAVAVADRLGIESFIAAGFSMGGGIAQLAWRRHADRVDGLVLCSTGPYFSSNDPEELARDQRMGAVAARFDRFVPVPSDRRLNDWSAHPAKWGISQFLSTPMSKLGAFSGAMAAFDARDWLGEVDVPTSVVVSTRDKTVPPERQRLLSGGIGGALEFPVDGGHAVCVLGAERFVPAFGDAVRSVLARTREPAALSG